MKLAIVGSQGKSFSEVQKNDAINLIGLIVAEKYRWYEDLMEGLWIVSGGEPTGVDAWAEQEANSWGVPTIIHHPKTKDWQGFKARNILVAEACTVLYAIRSTKSTTYGSGWTADYAEKLGKEVHRYYV